MEVKSKSEMEADPKSRDMDLLVMVDILDRSTPGGDFGINDTILVRAKIEDGAWICKGNYEHVDYGERLDDPSNPHLSIVAARIHPDLVMVVAS